MKKLIAAAALAVVLPAAAAPAADPLAIRQQLVDAIAAGNVSKAMALYADDAMSNGCLPAPCLDRKSIERDIRERIKHRNRAVALSSHVAGNVLTTKVQLKSDLISDIGFERVIFWAIYETRNGKIVSETVAWDRTDDETRRYVDWITEYARTSEQGTPIEPK